MDFSLIIDNFLNNNSKKDKIIVIYWPTACWKTWMSIEIAKKLNTEIISTDSRQIYKYLNIWTWKVTEKEKSWVPHHMLDIINPDENYSVWIFKEESEKIINEIQNKWKIPILAWGTWLYIDSLIFDFNIPRVVADLELRKKLEEEAENFWKDFIYEKLKNIDPEYALELHPNNLNYVIRAIEVKTITWKSKSEFREEKSLKYDTLFLTPYTWDREALYNKINLRVWMMFEDWLVDEVKKLLEIWYKKTDTWMKTIWYKEVVSYLEREIDLETCISQVQQFNRNYAKRQLTWFRKYEEFI
jgi:tRNA dimethylallyltransferase